MKTFVCKVVVAAMLLALSGPSVAATAAQARPNGSALVVDSLTGVSLPRAGDVASVIGTVRAPAQGGRGQAAAKKERAVLTLPATGTFALGGEFRGTISINRFERRGDEIVAIGLVAGVLSRGPITLGSTVAGEVAWPVRVTSGGVAGVNNRAPALRGGQVIRAAWSPGASPAATALLPVQAPETCPVLNVALGPHAVDLLGFQVALSAVTLDLTGVVGTPLGDLVCAASDLLGNVAALVNLLNSLLGLVTGLLGGLTGGIGGGIGGIVPIQ
jgi:hypothetical protein